jgi:hypothetical protein
VLQIHVLPVSVDACQTVVCAVFAIDGEALGECNKTTVGAIAAFLQEVAISSLVARVD